MPTGTGDSSRRRRWKIRGQQTRERASFMTLSPRTTRPFAFGSTVGSPPFSPFFILVLRSSVPPMRARHVTPLYPSPARPNFRAGFRLGRNEAQEARCPQSAIPSRAAKFIHVAVESAVRPLSIPSQFHPHIHTRNKRTRTHTQ